MQMKLLTFTMVQYQMTGVTLSNTKAMFNQGFTIENPLDNMITNQM